MKLYDDMRARFHELGRQREDILARSMPMREERDRLAQAARAQELALNAQIKEIEASLYSIDVERGRLSRALRDDPASPISNTAL